MPITPSDFQDKTISQLVDLIQGEGLSIAESNYLIGNYILERSGKAKRSFNYTTGFPDSDPACASGFERSFVHQDWVDGESIVQAEQTSVEEGFNRRFHAIEEDLEALGSDVARSFVCMAEMRRDLHALLQEIRTELNRLNSDVHDCCAKPTPTAPTPPGFVTDIDRVPIGTTTFNDSNYYIYKVNDVFEFYPVVNPPSVVNPIDVFDDRTVRAPGEVARILAEHEEIVDFIVNESPTKDRLIERFGDVSTPTGGAFRDLIRTLPADRSYDDPGTLVDDLAERGAAILRVSNRGNVLASSFGVGRDVGLIGEAPVERLSVVPNRAREALRASGIDTVERLAATDPRALLEVMRAAGVEAGAGDVAAWRATAGTVGRLR